MKYVRLRILLYIILAVLIAASAFYQCFYLKKRQIREPKERKMEIVKDFSFDAATALKEWEEKIFKGRVSYKVEKSGENSYVRAESDASASALYHRLKINAKTSDPLVSWKWRAEKFPEKERPENLDVQDEDDFAARFYIIFPAFFFTNSKVLEYVWAEKLPVGTIGTSPYSKNIKIFVLRSGLSNEWASEERDIRSDYQKAFGCAPEYDIGAVAFMTNTEHTGKKAAAVYDDIKIGYKTE